MLFTLDYLILRRVNKSIFLKDCITCNRHSSNCYLYCIQILIQVTSWCNNYMQIITILSVTYQRGRMKTVNTRSKIRKRKWTIYLLNKHVWWYVSLFNVYLFVLHKHVCSILHGPPHYYICSLRVRFRYFIFGRRGCMCWPPEGLWRKVVSSAQTIRTHFLLIRKPSWP